MYWGLIFIPAKLSYTKKVPWVDDIKHATAYWWKSNAFLWKEAGLGGRGTVGGALGRGWFDKCVTLYSGLSWEWDRSVGIAFRHVEPPHQVVRTLGDPGCMKHHFGNRDSFIRNRRFTEGLENYQFWVQKPETDNSQYIESWNYSISLVQHLVQSKVSSNHLLHPHVPGSVGPLFLKLQTYSLVRIVQPELYCWNN